MQDSRITPASVRVEAPARLHFGLLSFGNPSGRQFGGAGVMVDGPQLVLEVQPASHLEVTGPLAQRARSVICHWQKYHHHPEPACRVRILQTPRQHVGLGSGTQFALAVATGLNALYGIQPSSARELAVSVHRGSRSAIGTYGFLQGGLLVEAGKLADESLSPLLARVELPESWRFVLLCPKQLEGVSGDDEREAFSSLPPVPAEVTAELCREILLHLLPAAILGDFDALSESIYRYGYSAGLCFSQRQNGAFASRRAAALVAQLHELGVRGVGQSSWGPTIFALVRNAAEVEHLLNAIRERDHVGDLDTLIATPCPHGARVTVER